MLFCALFLMLSPQELSGQTYQDGYKKYTMGDMVGAQKALMPALRNPAANTAERAQTYKLLGIVQYQMNKKDQAATSFKAAIALNAALSIKPDEVLDGSVIDFFNKVKSAYRNAPPPKVAASAAASPPEAAPASGAKGDRAKGDGTKAGAPTTRAFGEKSGKSTRLLVHSNAPGASILIDDILVGSAGRDLEVNPGSVTLTLKANGYKPKTFRMAIKKGALNQVDLNLEKVAKKQPKTVVAAASPIGMKQNAADKGKAKTSGKKKTSGDLFADDEPDYSAPRKSLASLPGPGDMTPPPIAAAPMALAPASAPAAAPGAPAAGYAVGAPAGAPAGTMAMTLPQPAPGGGAQVVVVPISPGATYNQPMMPTYPYGGGYGSPYPAPSYPGYPPMGYGDGQAPIAPAPLPPPDYYGNGKSKKGKPKAHKPRPSPLLMLLPFGVPQMANGSYVAGMLLGGLQAGALYWYYQNDQSATQAYAQAKTVANDPSYTSDQDKTNQAEYLKQMDSYVKSKENQANIGLYSCLGLYAVSIVEGFITWNTPPRQAMAIINPEASEELSLNEQKDQDEDAKAPPARQPAPLKLNVGVLLTPDGSGAAPAFIMDYRF